MSSRGQHLAVYVDARGCGQPLVTVGSGRQSGNYNVNRDINAAALASGNSGGIRGQTCTIFIICLMGSDRILGREVQRLGIAPRRTASLDVLATCVPPAGSSQ